jgi:phosphate transport system permease protein
VDDLLINTGEVEGVEPRMPLRAPSRSGFGAFADTVFSFGTAFLALSILALLVAVGLMLIIESAPAIRQFGFHFFVSSDWDPGNDQYGALPFIYGTAVSSALALLIAVPLSLGVGLCLAEMVPDWLGHKVGFLVELGPWLRDHVEPLLAKHLGFLPLFQGPRVAVSMLNAGVVLAIMVLPYIAAVCTDVFRAVPRSNREAALALGATKWEMVTIAVLPYGASGVIGAVILGLGRALGETIAVAMVIGNRPEISASLFEPSSTLASVIANEFVEAISDLNVAALIELGLVLLLLGAVLNILARLLVYRATERRFRRAR